MNTIYMTALKHISFETGFWKYHDEEEEETDILTLNLDQTQRINHN